MRYLLSAAFLLMHCFVSAQVIPAERRTDWSLAGYRDTVPEYTTIVNITDFGGKGDGTYINDTAIENALVSLNGRSGTIYFPSGNFFFTRDIDLPDSVVLKGNGSDSTTLKFNLNGGRHLIHIQGGLSAVMQDFSADAFKDSNFITLSSTAGIFAGDWLHIMQNDSALVFSSWAYNSVGQLVEVKGVSGNRVNLNSPLRKNYSLSDKPRIIKTAMITGVGISCLKIERLDSTAGQMNNIDINYAVRCWVKGVESSMCNFGHIVISNSSNIEVTGCYLHDAFGYGGGGKAYGVVTQFTTGECLVENNVFNHLRHSMLLQAGANGNVFGYNSSTDPFWVSPPLPAESAGDMVLHGNYVYMNLFEGNMGQNIVIDDSHGKNGPYNTFFRNRADSYGIFMNTNPPSDTQNIVGNEITSNGFLQGLYSIAGAGHLEYGNNIKGNILPAGTNTLADSSYYKKRRPSFFPTTMKWPGIGIPNTISTGTIPATERKLQGGLLTDCSIFYQQDTIRDTTETSIPHFNTDMVTVYPNPSTGVFNVSYTGIEPLQLMLTDIAGKIVMEKPINATCVIDLSPCESGVYFLSAKTPFSGIETRKLIITKQ